MEKMVINDFDRDIASSSKLATAAGLVVFRLETYVPLLTLHLWLIGLVTIDSV